MLKISKMGRTLPFSPIRKLIPYSNAAKERGIKVYHLNIGQPDIPTPQVALDAMRNIDLDILAYSPSEGNASYRNKLSEKYYANLGIDISPDEIMVTTGGSEALVMAMEACLNPGEDILCPEPYYANYNSFAKQTRVNIKPIKSVIENDFALPPIEEFEKMIDDKTKAILICNPNNPTGYLYSKEEIETLAEIVKKHNLFLIVDEVYREFAYDGLEVFSSLNLKGVDENVVVVDSVSKRYSMCGVRVGALVTRNEELYSAFMRMAQARLSPPLLGQVAAEAAIDVPEDYFKNVIKEYTSRRDCFVELLNNMEGVYCPKPKGAFYSIVKLPIDDCEKFARWLLEEFEHNGETVMVAPATGFYATPESGKNEVRIAYVLNNADLVKAAECLEIALKEYPGRVL